VGLVKEAFGISKSSTTPPKFNTLKLRGKYVRAFFLLVYSIHDTPGKFRGIQDGSIPWGPAEWMFISPYMISYLLGGFNLPL